MLPAQSCLDCEGWRKSRLQIIRTNNYCKPVLEGCQVFIVAANHLRRRKFNDACTSAALSDCRNLTLNFCQYSIFYRDAVKFNFLWQISSQKPSTNIQIFKNYFDSTTNPAYLPAVCSFSILQVIGIIKRRTAPQKIPFRIEWHELFWYKKSYDV